MVKLEQNHLSANNHGEIRAKTMIVANKATFGQNYYHFYESQFNNMIFNLVKNGF
jgi:hypothetical protein